MGGEIWRQSEEMRSDESWGPRAQFTQTGHFRYEGDERFVLLPYATAHQIVHERSLVQNFCRQRMFDGSAQHIQLASPTIWTVLRQSQWFLGWAQKCSMCDEEAAYKTRSTMWGWRRRVLHVFRWGWWQHHLQTKICSCVCKMQGNIPVHTAPSRRVPATE